MKWTAHNKWAEKLGIPNDVSEYVNQVVDVQDHEKLPDDYIRKVKLHSKGFGTESSGSAFHMVVSDYVTRSHDGARSKRTSSTFSASINKRILSEMGEEHLRCWYLHHHLDYLHENRNTSKSIIDLHDEFREKYPQTYSPLIEAFLLKHREELSNELSLGKVTYSSAELRERRRQLVRKHFG